MPSSFAMFQKKGLTEDTTKKRSVDSEQKPSESNKAYAYAAETEIAPELMEMDEEEDSGRSQSSRHNPFKTKLAPPGYQDSTPVDEDQAGETVD